MLAIYQQLVDIANSPSDRPADQVNSPTD